MAYEDAKIHQATPYHGARVGMTQRWQFRDAFWTETKRSPEEWDVTFWATQHRVTTAPPNSGAEVGSRFQWRIHGNQYVRKLDANTYETFLQGVKFRVGAVGPGKPFPRPPRPTFPRGPFLKGDYAPPTARFGEGGV